MSRIADGPQKGRGAISNADSRFSAQSHAVFHDDWDIDEEPATPLETTLIPERTKTILSRNDSPDIPFDVSINPYKGCEHAICRALAVFMT